MDASLKLSDSEHRCFWEMFNYLDGDSSGVLPTNQVYELFLTSGIATDVVHQILELCGAKQGHLSRNQFFIGLKLVAAAQNKYPVVLDVCYSGIELPLPRFMPHSETWRNQNLTAAYTKPQQTLQQQQALQQQQQQQQQQQALQQQQQQQALQQQQQQQALQQQQQQQQQQALQQQQIHQHQMQHIQQQMHQQQIQQQHMQHLHQQQLIQQRLQQVQFQKQQVAQHQIPQEVYHESGPRVASAYPSSRSMSLAGPSEVALFPQQPPVMSSALYLPPCSSMTPASNVGKHVSIGTAARKQSAPVVVQPPQQAVNSIGSRPRNESAFVDVKPEKGWASFEEDHRFQMQINQQQATHSETDNRGRQKEWANFSAEGTLADAVSISSEGGQDDVWCMTEEQRDYYINQFKTMQEDLRGTISGAVAKEFFEKSKLPVKELSKIWQLSDVNRDGVLTLSEFCTAMHLVVLRRNDIELPDQLPPSLFNQLQTFPYPDILHNGQGDESYAMESHSTAVGYKKSSSSPPSSLSSQVWNSGYSAPVESPTSSSVSSPGNKPTPVNFEFRPVTIDPDSKIVQPVAVKMSPDDTPFVVDSDVTGFPDESHNIMTSSVIKKLNKQDLLIDLETEHDGPTSLAPTAPLTVLQGRPRPTPIKPSDSNQQIHKKLFLPPSSSSLAASAAPGAERSDVPPPPPPRVGHSRNSSLDNQLISISPDGTGSPLSQVHVKFPPAVPPRPSSKERTLSSPEEVKKMKTAVAKHDSLDRRDLQASIRIQKERNQVLTRVNSELNQELQEVMEQRIALEIQMEHLQG